MLGPADARRMVLAAQRLVGPRPRPTRAAILGVVRDLGYLQLDPTNVVARSHLLVLWSRLGTYDTGLLDALLWRERRLFENAAFIMPTDDLPLHAVSMRAYPSARSARGRRVAAWMRDNDALRRHVLERLRREGALPLAAFEDRARTSWRSSGWTAERNVSQMLEFLWRQGRVAVAGRAPGGRRLWTLAQRWLPRVRPLTPRAAERAGTLRAVRTLGVATYRHLRYSYAFARFVTPAALAALERQGEVVRVEVRDAERPLRGPWFATRDATERARRIDVGSRATFLSPFDNLIIDRPRTEALFRFRYRMEIYVPREQRLRGYFALPILLGDRLVGSLDPRMDRARARLVVGALHLEPDAPRSREAAVAVRRALDELAAFLGAREVELPRALPNAWARGLRG